MHVDDIIVIGNNLREIDASIKFLVGKFELEDLGNLKHFSGIKVAKNKDGISTSHKKYVFNWNTWV